MRPHQLGVSAHFRDFATAVKPALDAAFRAQLVRLLGDTRPGHLIGADGLLTSGKKTRGALLCLVTSTLGGRLDDALPRAVAIELIQTATLIHDDFVDQHRVRRRLPALWTLDGARQAVLLGDVLFASAIAMMSELGAEDGAIASRAIADVARGAYQEPLDPLVLVDEIEAGRVDAALYERIIHLKSGVLFGAACRLGAVAARADETRQGRWLRYGQRVGEAYQIADDLHDVRQYLRTRSLEAGELAALSPALLFFAPESREPLLEAVRQGSSRANGQLVPCFAAAAVSMLAEIDRRLQAAEVEIEGHVPSHTYESLVRETPRALIAMFNEASAPASAP